jgi:hypothetical protein
VTRIDPHRWHHRLSQWLPISPGRALDLWHAGILPPSGTPRALVEDAFAAWCRAKPRRDLVDALKAVLAARDAGLPDPDTTARCREFADVRAIGDLTEAPTQPHLRVYGFAIDRKGQLWRGFARVIEASELHAIGRLYSRNLVQTGNTEAGFGSPERKRCWLAALIEVLDEAERVRELIGDAPTAVQP